MAIRLIAMLMPPIWVKGLLNSHTVKGTKMTSKLISNNKVCFKRSFEHLMPGFITFHLRGIISNSGGDYKLIDVVSKAGSNMKKRLKTIYLPVELVKENKPGSNILKQTEKMYLDNPDLYAR